MSTAVQFSATSDRPRTLTPRTGSHCQPTGATLFYTRLNEPKQKIEIAAVPVAGGPTTLIAADGFLPSPSPDDRTLAYISGTNRPELELMNLRSHQLRTVEIPRPAGVTNVDSVTWLSDARHVLVVTGMSGLNCDIPPGDGGTCTLAGAVDDHVRAWIYDTSGNAGWTQAPALASRQVTWQALRVLGPKPGTTEVIATEYDPAKSTATVYTVQPMTGQLTAIGETPKNDTVVAVDATGRNYLLTGAGIQRWRPGEPAVLIGPNQSEATW